MRKKLSFFDLNLLKIVLIVKGVLCSHFHNTPCFLFVYAGLRQPPVLFLLQPIFTLGYVNRQRNWELNRILLIPLHSEGDMDFRREKLQLSPEEMQEIADKIQAAFE